MGYFATPQLEDNGITKNSFPTLFFLEKNKNLTPFCSRRELFVAGYGINFTEITHAPPSVPDSKSMLARRPAHTESDRTLLFSRRHQIIQ